MLVGLANIEKFAAAVKESFAQLLGNGLGEVVIRFENDIGVVPGDVEDAYAGHEDDADVGEHVVGASGLGCLTCQWQRERGWGSFDIVR